MSDLYIAVELQNNSYCRQ